MSNLFFWKWWFVLYWSKFDSNTSLNTQACNLRLNETIIQIILPIIILSRLIKIIILIITIDTHST